MTRRALTVGQAQRLHRRRQARALASETTSRVMMVAFGAAIGLWVLSAPPAVAPKAHPAPAAQAVVAQATPSPILYNPLLDAAVSLGIAPVALAQSSPLASDFVFDSPPASPLVEAQPVDPPPQLIAEAEPDDASMPIPAPTAAPARLELAQDVPLPMPRPAEAAFPASQAPFRSTSRRVALQSRSPVSPVPPSDNRNFLEKFFGMGQPSGPALGYAAPESGLFGSVPSVTSSPMIPHDRTAVYEIATHTVYMPNGPKLEAHSGLGPLLDNPRYVNARNRGATPPQVYELSPREQLFHGVQALRLTPVGGGTTFGRNGLLAHTYMLGPNGDSNGCVSFRDYNAFLQAYLAGEVKRLVVVARLS